MVYWHLPGYWGCGIALIAKFSCGELKSAKLVCKDVFSEDFEWCSDANDQGTNQVAKESDIGD